jgi:hypothetical protein
MIANNYYTIDLAFQGIEQTIDPNNISFSLHESLWQMYSNATLQIKDISGILHEYMLDIEGGIFTIQYGVKDGTTIKSNYVVISNETPDNATTGLLSGTLNMSLLHEYYNYQTVLSKAYSGRISAIVKNVLSDYNFSSIVMNDTGSNSIWYRMKQSQKDFIEQVLLPNAYSTNAEYTPYFAYITTDNNFNFRNYKEFLDKKYTFELTYKPNKKDNTTLETILDIKPFRNGSFKTKFARNRTIITRDYSNGSFTSETDLITKYPTTKRSSYKVPIIGDSSLITDYTYYNFTQEEQGEKEALEARKRFDERESYFLDKLLITTMFNPDIHVGQILSIKVSTVSDKGNVEYGLSQSGNYVVEDCVHSWEGLTARKGYTYLIVSRKFMETPAYLVKDLLIT